MHVLLLRYGHWHKVFLLNFSQPWLGLQLQKEHLISIVPATIHERLTRRLKISHQDGQATLYCTRSRKVGTKKTVSILINLPTRNIYQRFSLPWESEPMKFELVDMPVATQSTSLPSSTPPLELLSLLQSLWGLAQPPCGVPSAPTSLKLGTGMGLAFCQGIQMNTLRFTETINCWNWPIWYWTRQT